MSIGDINSQARGSGARFNDGKPAMQLIDFEFLAGVYESGGLGPPLRSLATFQQTGRSGPLFQAFDEFCEAFEITEEELLRSAARVFDYGRKKYAEWNWAKGMPWSVPLACIARHALSIAEGEEIDPESGEPHYGHIVCNLVMLHTFTRAYPEGNDLPIKELGAKPTDLFETPPSLDEAVLRPYSVLQFLRKMRETMGERNVGSPYYLSYLEDGVTRAAKIELWDGGPIDEGYWYVATPYTSHPGGQTNAYHEANRAAARLHTEHGLLVFSPIAHSHSLCEVYGTTDGITDHLDAQFWKRFDKPLLDAAFGLAVVIMPGFDVSYGINHEVNEARRQGKPIRYYNWPELMDITDRVEKLANMGSVSFSFAPKEEAA